MSNPSTKRHDPLTVFCFRVQLFDLPGMAKGEGFFKSVSGLSYDTEVVDYKEGGQNVTTHKLVGSTKWKNITLKKGFVGPPVTQLLHWRQLWLSDLPLPAPVLTRMNGKIIQLSSDMEPVCAWKFLNGWPCKWDGPEYDASKDELAIETLEIAHEGLIFDPTGKAP